MPQDYRIRRLLDLLPGELSQEKLDTLSSAFDSLAQDSAEVLPFSSCITFADGFPPRSKAKPSRSHGITN